MQLFPGASLASVELEHVLEQVVHAFDRLMAAPGVDVVEQPGRIRQAGLVSDALQVPDEDPVVEVHQYAPETSAVTMKLLRSTP